MFQTVILDFSSNGTFTYTPTTGFNGKDSFTYYSTDGIFNSNIATVELTVKSNETTNIPTDFDSDNDMDKDDLTVLKAYFGQNASSSNDPYDVNKDGKINVLDFRLAIQLCTRPRCATF